jgi:hypothetical protein
MTVTLRTHPHKALLNPRPCDIVISEIGCFQLPSCHFEERSDEKSPGSQIASGQDGDFSLIARNDMLEQLPKFKPSQPIRVTS